MGRKPVKIKNTHNIVFPKTEEEIEDMKHMYYIQGKPILALNENIANEIYMRKYKELNDLDYFKQKIYEISGVPKSRLGSMENIAKRNKKEVDELFGESLSKTFVIRIGDFRFRFLYDPCILIDGWVNISFHFSYTLKHTLNFHMSVRKKWPFIKIGFSNIYPKLYKGGGF